MFSYHLCLTIISTQRIDIGNHWDGQSKGTHHRSGKEGLFPAYKVEDIHDVADYPDYTDIDQGADKEEK